MHSDPTPETDLSDIIWGDAAGAEHLRIPLPTFKRLVAAGVIPKVQIPGYKRNGYRCSELKATVVPV